MSLNDDLDRLERRMRELKAEAKRLTAELERIGQHDLPPLLSGRSNSAEPAAGDASASSDDQAA